MERFPEDFLIVPNSSELSERISQIAIFEGLIGRNLVFKSSPNLFTENGVAMESSRKDELGTLQQNTNQLFKIVFERLDNLDDQITPKLPANRKKIGLKPDLKTRD